MKNFKLYSKENIHFVGQTISVLLKEAIEDTNPKIMIDIGCGDGRELVYLARCYQKAEVIGLDFSLLRLGRARSECVRLSLIQADANMALPFKLETIDFVLCSQVIEHLKSD